MQAFEHELDRAGQPGRGLADAEVTESYEVLWEPWYAKLFTPEKRRGPQLDEGIDLTLSRLKAAAETGADRG